MKTLKFVLCLLFLLAHSFLNVMVEDLYASSSVFDKQILSQFLSLQKHLRYIGYLSYKLLNKNPMYSTSQKQGINNLFGESTRILNVIAKRIKESSSKEKKTTCSATNSEVEFLNKYIPLSSDGRILSKKRSLMLTLINHWLYTGFWLYKLLRNNANYSNSQKKKIDSFFKLNLKLMLKISLIFSELKKKRKNRRDFYEDDYDSGRYYRNSYRRDDDLDESNQLYKYSYRGKRKIKKYRQDYCDDFDESDQLYEHSHDDEKHRVRKYRWGDDYDYDFNKLDQSHKYFYDGEGRRIKKYGWDGGYDYDFNKLDQLYEYSLNEKRRIRKYNWDDEDADSAEYFYDDSGYRKGPRRIKPYKWEDEDENIDSSDNPEPSPDDSGSSQSPQPPIDGSQSDDQANVTNPDPTTPIIDPSTPVTPIVPITPENPAIPINPEVPVNPVPIIPTIPAGPNQPAVIPEEPVIDPINPENPNSTVPGGPAVVNPTPDGPTNSIPGTPVNPTPVVPDATAPVNPDISIIPIAPTTPNVVIPNEPVVPGITTTIPSVSIDSGVTSSNPPINVEVPAATVAPITSVSGVIPSVSEVVLPNAGTVGTGVITSSGNIPTSPTFTVVPQSGNGGEVTIVPNSSAQQQPWQNGFSSSSSYSSGYASNGSSDISNNNSSFGNRYDGAQNNGSMPNDSYNGTNNIVPNDGYNGVSSVPNAISNGGYSGINNNGKTTNGYVGNGISVDNGFGNHYDGNNTPQSTANNNSHPYFQQSVTQNGYNGGGSTDSGILNSGHIDNNARNQRQLQNQAFSQIRRNPINPEIVPNQLKNQEISAKGDNSEEKLTQKREFQVGAGTQMISDRHGQLQKEKEVNENNLKESMQSQNSEKIYNNKKEIEPMTRPRTVSAAIDRSNDGNTNLAPAERELKYKKIEQMTRPAYLPDLKEHAAYWYDDTEEMTNDAMDGATWTTGGTNYNYKIVGRRVQQENIYKVNRRNGGRINVEDF